MVKQAVKPLIKSKPKPTVSIAISESLLLFLQRKKRETGISISSIVDQVLCDHFEEELRTNQPKQ